MHGLEQAASAARSGNAARLVELTDGLVKGKHVSTDALSGSPVLRDLFSENGAERLVGGDATPSSAAAAASGAGQSARDAAYAAAKSILVSDVTGDEFAAAVKAQLTAFPITDAAPALMQAVLEVCVRVLSFKLLCVMCSRAKMITILPDN